MISIIRLFSYKTELQFECNLRFYPKSCGRKCFKKVHYKIQVEINILQSARKHDIDRSIKVSRFGNV